MTISPYWLGIDVSKATLDLFDEQSGRFIRLANEPASITELVDQLYGHKVQVIFEATGQYDRLLRTALSAAGIGFVRVNPGRARDFARATGLLAKTDALDARMLAAMGRTLGPEQTTPQDPDRERLTALHRRRDQLVSMRQQERVRHADPVDDETREDIDAHLAWLDEAIARIEKRIRDHIGACEALSRQEALIRSVPGIGPVTATTLLALMPELGCRSAKTIAALPGLAPFNVDSGTMRGQRHIKGGRSRVRKALYMAAVTAIRTKSRFASFYKKLRNAGKPAKVALIAVARKIIVTINAIIKTQTPYHQ